MIRINLLPVRAERKKEQGRLQLGILVLVVLLAGVANWLWFKSADNRLEEVQAQVRQTQQQIAQLEAIIGEVNDIQKRKEELQQKLEVIEQLRKQKTGPVKMLDALSTLIPKEVWIDSFAEKQGAFTLKGTALSHEDLAGFLKGLKESPYFKEVELKTATLQRNKQGGRDLVNFTLSGRADYAA